MSDFINTHSPASPNLRCSEKFWILGLLPLLGVSLCFSLATSPVQAVPVAAVKGETFFEAPSWEEFRTRSRAWIEATNATQLPLWEQQVPSDQATAMSPLAAIPVVLAVGYPEHKNWLEQIAKAPNYQMAALLEDPPLSIQESWMNSNYHLWLGMELSQRQLYEEALAELEQADPALVVDPAGYFFNRAVCEHHLLRKEPATASLDHLLTSCRPLPTRYRTLGELMQQDLAKLEEKSLDEIARKMRDVERRLELGRSGQKVQKVEKEIIESLDELIAKLEQQGGGGGGSGQSPGNMPTSPADESRVKGATAPGDVDKKDLGRQDGWGNLPPKEQAQAKQILGTLFPPHYQRAIEAYNRKAAQRSGPNP